MPDSKLAPGGEPEPSPGLLQSPAEILQGIADAIPDPSFAARLRRVFDEAVKTSEELGELALGRYEDMAETGVPAIELWDEVAPVIRNTVLAVNRLLSIAQEVFPPETKGGIADLIDETLEDFSGDGAQQALIKRRREEASHHIRVVSNALVGEISALGERMRSPKVVSDRWNLLTDIQEFRGRFRTAVGDLIFLSALPFAPVRRAEVIPGYLEEVREAIASRKAVTDLARLMNVHAGKVTEACPEEAPALASDLKRALDAFGRSRSYVLLRAQDKRRLVELRAALGSETPEIGTVKSVIAELAQFTQGLSHINNRACLVEHDRETFAACSVALERIEALPRAEAAQRAAIFAQAVEQAGELYGRHPSLDAYLRKARKRDLAKIGGAELDFELELFRGLLSASSAI